MPLPTALRTSLVAALIALPVAASAQSDGAADPTALPLGQTPVGGTYVAETYGDWELRCIRTADDQPEPCQLYQLLSDESGNPVAEMNVFELEDNGPVAAGATIVTPLDTLLTPGMRMRVDEGPWAEYPFAFCQPVGCFARLGLTNQDLDSLRAGGTATVAIVPLPAPDRIVTLQASLSGFTAGLAALAERLPEVEPRGMFDMD